MERKASTQKRMPSVDNDTSTSIDPDKIVNVRITRTETIATRGISFALMMDIDMCQRIVRELRTANNRISDILNEINDYRIDRDLYTLIAENRSKLSRYSLVQSDCYWTRLDSDLSMALDMMDECRDILMRKFREEFRLSDLLYMIKVLETVREEFERKIEQIEEVLK